MTTLIVIFFALLAQSQRQIPVSDELDRASLKVVGPTFVECGRVAIRGNRKAARDCMAKALGENKPFRARFDLQGIDSDVALSVAASPKGEVFIMEFDGDPMGGGGTDKQRQQVTIIPCKKPRFPVGVGKKLIECFPYELNQAPDIMSPVIN